MLHIILIVVVGFSMIACEQATDPVTVNTAPGNTTVTPGTGSLPAFTLNSAVHPGGVLLTWDLVKDAAGYEVWRQANEGAVLLGTVNDKTKYADIKTRLNDLKAGIDYKYTVIAVSAASTSQGAAPVVIQSSKAEKTVNFTAANLEVTLTPVTSLSLAVTPYSRVLATWDADANPLVSYEIFENEDFITTVDTPHYDFALRGGTVADVMVRKVLYNNEDDIAYYSPSEDVNAVITVFNKGTYTVEARRDNNAQVQLILSDIPGTGLAPFTLSRYKYAASGAETPTWTSVSLVGARLLANNDLTNVYEVYDTLPENSETATFTYRLVGTYPGVDQLKSVVYSDPLVPPLFNVMSLKNITLTPVANTTPPQSPNTSVDDLEAYYHLFHDVEADAEYAYFIKQVSGANGIPLPANEAYDWVPITIPAADKTTSRTSQTVKVTVPAARTYYEFKVVATGTGSKAGYKNVEAKAGPVQFRTPIRPVGFDFAAPGAVLEDEQAYIPEYFTIILGTIVGDADDGITAVLEGTQYNTDNNRSLRNVYSLSLTGLIGVNLKRADEILDIELISTKGLPPQMVNNVNRSTSWTGIEVTPPATQTQNLDTLTYYFTIPTDTSGNSMGTDPIYTVVRLHVTAK
jgi:hypothetical protein